MHLQKRRQVYNRPRPFLAHMLRRSSNIWWWLSLMLLFPSPCLPDLFHLIFFIFQIHPSWWSCQILRQVKNMNTTSSGSLLSNSPFIVLLSSLLNPCSFIYICTTFFPWHLTLELSDQKDDLEQSKSHTLSWKYSFMWICKFENSF